MPQQRLGQGCKLNSGHDIIMDYHCVFFMNIFTLSVQSKASKAFDTLFKNNYMPTGVQVKKISVPWAKI